MYILHHIYDIKEKQTEDLLDVTSKNLIGKEHFLTSVNEKVYIFNRTILNILSNFMQHEIIVCNDKDPPCFNNRKNVLIQEKKKLDIRFIAITKIILI